MARMTTLPPVLAALARRLHALPGDDHRVASALGVWLLLALVARAAGDRPLPDLDEALGMPRADALALSGRLMAHQHPAVKDAYAAWARADLLDGPLGDFLRSLPEPVERGALPSQAEADAWASRATDGLIERYPVALHPATWVTLATALATQVTWTTPFDLAPSDALGAGPFAAAVTRVLAAVPGPGHSAWIADTAVGHVAVHVASSAHLEVWAVSAAPEVAPAAVLDAAHALAADPRPVDLGALPLGAGHSWQITEERGFGEDAVTRVLLPAWEARTTTDLSAEPAFGDAGRALAALLGERDFLVDAAQSAMARYHQYGFEAAAVTAMAVRAMGAPRPRKVRRATLRFGHPYAVVAFTSSGTRSSGPARKTACDPWAGLPAFSAWVATPQEPGRRSGAHNVPQ